MSKRLRATERTDSKRSSSGLMAEIINAGIRVVSRRTVRPFSPQLTVNGNKKWHASKEVEVEVIHLTPWDLSLISIDYIKKGIVLPKPPSGDGKALVDALASSFARAIGRFYPFAGRLVAEEHEDDGTVTLSLRCTGEGAEFVHAAAPELTVNDTVAPPYTLPAVSAALYPLDGVLGADAALLESIIPLVAVQVTELADGVFIGMSMNHSVGDGASFWHLFNTWSEIHRCGGGNNLLEVSTPPPFFQRWFVESTPVPIPMPFPKLQDIVRRFDGALFGLHECFFTLSAASVEKLVKKANYEMATAGIMVSSLHAVLAHLWRAVCRARQHPTEQSTSYTLVAGIWSRVNGIPPGYIGNAMVFGTAKATAGEIEEKGLGWTAWLLNCAATTSFDEVAMRASLERWVREPSFTYMVGNHPSFSSGGGTGLVSGERDLAALDVFGNDFGWGKPVAVRSGPGNKANGKVTVFEGPERGESVSLEVCLSHDALVRLVADEEFMDAVAKLRT